jgi:hypothetical protein
MMGILAGAHLAAYDPCMLLASAPTLAPKCQRARFRGAGEVCWQLGGVTVSRPDGPGTPVSS